MKVCHQYGLAPSYYAEDLKSCSELNGHQAQPLNSPASRNIAPYASLVAIGAYGYPGWVVFGAVPKALPIKAAGPTINLKPIVQLRSVI